jgi:hypothetical protein
MSYVTAEWPTIRPCPRLMLPMTATTSTPLTGTDNDDNPIGPVYPQLLRKEK